MGHFQLPQHQQQQQTDEREKRSDGCKCADMWRNSRTFNNNLLNRFTS